jgi:hypothetical protein
MGTVRKKRCESLLCFRNGIREDDADMVEAMLAGKRAQPRLQKSRSA